jgi:hypothetical protein
MFKHSVHATEKMLAETASSRSARDESSNIKPLLRPIGMLKVENEHAVAIEHQCSDCFPCHILPDLPVYGLGVFFVKNTVEMSKKRLKKNFAVRKGVVNVQNKLKLHNLSKKTFPWELDSAAGDGPKLRKADPLASSSLTGY